MQIAPTILTADRPELHVTLYLGKFIDSFCIYSQALIALRQNPSKLPSRMILVHCLISRLRTTPVKVESKNTCGINEIYNLSLNLWRWVCSLRARVCAYVYSHVYA
jgi:hypothetical protein